MNKTLTPGLFIKAVFLNVILISNALNAQNLAWQKTIGGNYLDYSPKVRPTSDGGFILCGQSRSGISGDKSENNQDTTFSSSDYWVIKLDGNGNVQWDNTIGGATTDVVGDIVETIDGGFLIGGKSQSEISGDKTEAGCNTYINYGDYWVVKINSSGNIEWQNTIGALGGESLYSIDKTSDGGFLLGGISNSNISCDKTEINNAGNNGGGYPGAGGGTSDYWIVKIDSTGNILCQKTLGRGSWASDFLTSVASTSDGGFICTGSSSAPYGNPVYGASDFWVVKLSSSCVMEWQKVIGGSSSESSGVIKQLSDGGYICGGSSASGVSGLKTDSSFGLYDFWILKLDSGGNIVWQKTIGGSGNDVLGDISPTYDNGFICGGSSASPLSGLKTSACYGHNDCWILKLDSVGNIQWQRDLGGNDNDVLYNMSQMTNGNFFGGGHSISNISGNKTENAKGSYDFWIFELDDRTEYNLITGKTFFDYNSNNVKDSSDIYLPYQIIKETNTDRFTFSQADGMYRLPVSDTGTFTVTQIQHPFYISSIPVSHNALFTGMNQTDSLNDFAIQQTIFINDLQISITPVGNFRPGFNATYRIAYKNAGTTSLQGTVLFYPDSALTFISSTLPPGFVSGDSIVWQTPVLYPYYQGHIDVTVHLNSATPLGSMVNASVKIEPLNNDQNPADNYASLQRIVTGSFDPNEILVDKDSITTDELIASSYLDYIIRFQNTGTDTAFQVKILNPINTSKLDLMTFEIISSSHIFSLNYNHDDQNLEFIFENILLPDSNTDEPGSHGFVRYRIKAKSSIVVHDSVTNYAGIYFDHNLPVVTNTAVTRIVYPENYIELYATFCGTFISPSGNYTWNSSGLYFDTLPGVGNNQDSIYVMHLTNGTSYGSKSIVTCDNYISPSGQFIWNISGVFADTLVNIIGCDSVITINLTKNSHSVAQLQINACDSFAAPGGNIFWTTSGTYYDTIPNSLGCDSVLIIQLSIFSPSDSTINLSACHNFTSPSGIYVWSASGTYTDTLQNISGCDSIITINLTVNESSNSFLTMVECGSYMSSGNNHAWNVSGIYSDTIPNATGCDSVITISLTILNQATSTLNITECNRYTSPSGNYTWASSGIYSDTILNTTGCDYILIINLTINAADSSITANPPLLYANATGAGYQWMFCDSVIIAGEINQLFIASVNGSYSVIISQNGCVDTSACVTVFNIGTNEHMYSGDFFVFPNPSSGDFIISFKEIIQKGELKILNTHGEIVYEQIILNESKKKIQLNNISPGIYFVNVFDGKKNYRNKLIVKHD